MELVTLRRVIRAHAANEPVADAEELYERHGIDVGAWRDVEARDHHGRMVDIDLAAPRVAPLGASAAREVGVIIDLTDLLVGVEVANADVHFDGVPPGTLISHGRNLGGGHWRIGAVDCGPSLRAFPSPFGCGGHSVVATVRGIDNGRVLRNGTVDISADMAILGALARRPLGDGRLPLETGELDPHGHGAAQLTFSDLPPGALLSRGTNHGGGVWTLAGWRGEDIFVTPPQALHGGSRFSIIATTFDDESGDTAIVSRDLMVSPGGAVSPVGDAAVV